MAAEELIRELQRAGLGDIEEAGARLKVRLSVLHDYMAGRKVIPDFVAMAVSAFLDRPRWKSLA